MSRLNNLASAITESTGRMSGVVCSMVACVAYAGLFVVYDRSLATSAVSLSVFVVAMFSVCVVYFNALSHGSDAVERKRSVQRFSLLIFTLFNTGMLLSSACYLAGDALAAYFASHPEHFIVAVAAAAVTGILLIVSAFHFAFAEISKKASILDAPAMFREQMIQKIEVSEARAPTTSLRYSEKDRKRKAAHFAGRVMCFAGSPYLDDDFDFEINEEFAQINYRSDDTYEDEGFLYWMVFQLLAAQQSEVAFAKKASRISWQHYADIEHYVAQLLATRPGASRILRDPKTPAELDWRAKRIRFFVKETMPKVHAFLRHNTDQLKAITKSTLSGTLTPLELRTVLRSIDTAHLPAHWDESKTGRNHLTLVN